MKVSDERLARLLENYTWLSLHPSHSGRNDRAQSDAEHASILKELQDYRSSEEFLRSAPEPHGSADNQRPTAWEPPQEPPSFRKDCPMMTPSKFLSNACPQTREAALDEVTSLQRLETAPSLSAYLTAWVLVEQELNTLRLNGRFDEADAGQAEFDRITAEVGPRLRRQDYDSIRIYSLAEMAELSKPATLDDATRIVCADILSGSLGSYGKVAAE